MQSNNAWRERESRRRNEVVDCDGTNGAKKEEFSIRRAWIVTSRLGQNVVDG